MYQLDKALYGLKQAPRAWYEHLTELLQDRGFEVGLIDPTLFTKKVKGELFLCQLYVDDIIFGSPNKAFNEEFAALMKVQDVFHGRVEVLSRVRNEATKRRNLHQQSQIHSRHAQEIQAK